MPLILGLLDVNPLNLKEKEWKILLNKARPFPIMKNVFNSLCLNKPELALQIFDNEGEFLQLISLMENEILLPSNAFKIFQDKLSNKEISNFNLQQLMNSWAILSPRDALDKAIELEAENTNLSLSYGVVTAWARKSPRNAVQYIRNNKGYVQNTRDQLLRTALSSWVHSDGISAIRFLDSNLEIPEWIRSSTYRVWARESPSKAVAYLYNKIILNPSTLSNSSRNFKSSIKSWASKEKGRVMDWLKKLPQSKIKDVAISGLAKAYADKNASDSHFLIEKIENASIRKETIDYIAKKHLNENPKEAVDWLLGLPDSIHFNENLEYVYDEWSKQAPRAAAESFPYEMDPQLQSKIAKAIVKNLVTFAPEYTLDWMDSLPSSIKKNTLVIASDHLTYTFPEQFAEYLESIPSNEKNIRSYQYLYANWGEFDFNGLIEWHDKNKPSNTYLFGSFMNKATIRYPEKVLDWIEQAEEGPRHTKAIEWYTYRHLGFEPELSIDLAARVEKSKRQKVLKGMSFWFHSYGWDYQELIDKNTKLDPEDKKLMHSYLEKNTYLD